MYSSGSEITTDDRESPMVNLVATCASILHFCGCIGIRGEASIRASLPIEWPQRRNLLVRALFPYSGDSIEWHLVALIRLSYEQASLRQPRCSRNLRSECNCCYCSFLANTENKDRRTGIHLSIGYQKYHSKGHRRSCNGEICFHTESRMSKSEAF